MGIDNYPFRRVDDFLFFYFLALGGSSSREGSNADQSILTAGSLDSTKSVATSEYIIINNPTVTSEASGIANKVLAGPFPCSFTDNSMTVLRLIWI